MNNYYFIKRFDRVNYSVPELAEKLGWTEASAKVLISQYKNNVKPIPPAHAVLLAKHVLDIPARWLMSAPVLCSDKGLADYFIELFWPGAERPEYKIELNGDDVCLRLNPDLDERLLRWIESRDSYLNFGAIDRFTYETGLFNLVADDSRITLGAGGSENINRKVRQIVNIKECLSDVSLETLPLYWFAETRSFSKSDIAEIAAGLGVPEERLTDDFFFRTDDDLLMFLLHIELSDPDSRSRIIPVRASYGPVISVRDGYLKAVIRTAARYRQDLADKKIDEIQCRNLLAGIPNRA